MGYLIYQAERRMSPAEQRAVDTKRGELAAALSSLLRRDRTAIPAIPATTLSSQPALAAIPECACALIGEPAHS